MFEIEVDQFRKRIQVGPVKFDSPRLAHRREHEFSIKRSICGDPPDDYDLKASHAFYALRLGPKFNRRFQAANYWLWLGNRVTPRTANLLRLSGRQWRHYSDQLVESANAVLPYVNEAEADDLYNLIPAIVVFRKSPHDIRRYVGKGAWKRIASQSTTRNQKIMQACDRNGLSPEDFVVLSECSSGVLDAMEDAEPQSLMAARLAPKKTRNEFLRTLHTVRDAVRMIGDDFSYEWSLNRLEAEHERAVRGLRKKKYSDVPFSVAWNYTRPPYEAELLTSALDIAVEGDAQHHCVASYAHEARSGNYAVLRISGAERATLGLLRRPNWRVHQLYGACNSAVSEACHVFASEVAQALDRAAREAA